MSHLIGQPAQNSRSEALDLVFTGVTLIHRHSAAYLQHLLSYTITAASENSVNGLAPTGPAPAEYRAKRCRQPRAACWGWEQQEDMSQSEGQLDNPAKRSQLRRSTVHAFHNTDLVTPPTTELGFSRTALAAVGPVKTTSDAAGTAFYSRVLTLESSFIFTTWLTCKWCINTCVFTASTS